ncbi:putative Eukaryotic translation initiation factor 3 subunit K [Hypsibius exemplaris]|uniref:Eukaryotic translation initiation factor 3 subunit K n=1 Tax=Hypsibius exemplaris TaxID=2072580 RepID=A0A1W0WC01_HYPEX|nr:putative Eukaryotic translation initiation factor 3 subunit K [Hypsibius exemplaris]
MSAREREEIASIFDSDIDRYNPGNMGILEQHVETQARENYYDLEANLLLLKLYQLNPGGSFTATRASSVTKILLKALMQLPKNDFQICKALTDPELGRVLRIQDVLRLETSLETCQFDFFWDDLENCRDSVSGVEGFDTAIRNYICSVIGMTNQTINERQLNSFLGKLPQEKLRRLVEEKGWKFLGNGIVYIKDQAASVKSRKITEAIEFADVATILTAVARR